MSTPVKLSALLSPKVLSPLSPASPRLLSVPRKFDNSLKPTHYPEEAKRINHVTKSLEYSKYVEDAIEIKVTDCSASNRELTKGSDVIINTPNRRCISEYGIGGPDHTVLGVGSFGRVVRGIHKGKTVAVKVVRNKSTINEKNALDLNHDNIVRTLDIVQNQEEIFSLIIMEYFPNSRQLQTLLGDCDFAIDSKMISFAVDICNGLNFIHNKSILHLDLKPQNILVAGNVCKICDFGNSVTATEPENFNHQGTAVYTAPELLQGKSPSEKCDVYSLGIVLWQLKTRCRPYHEMDNVETVIYKVVKCNCRPEISIPTDDYSKLYQACWDPDPNSRPSTWNILYKLKLML